jgi:hypothetical protein
MNRATTWGTGILMAFLLPCVSGLPGAAPASGANAVASVAAYRDGQHDFDFELGTWKIHLSRLQDRLAGSTTWVEFDGTSVTRKVWDGRANFEEFETDSPTGHIEGLTLRVYNPQTRQWSIYWANSKDPALGQPIQPMVGEFKDGRGEFYDQELWKGRSVYVRFIWSDITPDSAHFEQAFSDDGGKTWEINGSRTRRGFSEEIVRSRLRAGVFVGAVSSIRLRPRRRWSTFNI